MTYSIGKKVKLLKIMQTLDHAFAKGAVLTITEYEEPDKILLIDDHYNELMLTSGQYIEPV